MRLSALQYLGVQVSFSALALIFFGLRLLARHLGQVKFGLDDGFLFLGVVFLVGLNMTGGSVYANINAGGGSVDTLNPSQLIHFRLSFYASQILYYLCMLPVKLSVLSLYVRLFGTGKAFRNAVWLLGGLSFAWALGGLIPTIVQCQPVPYYWNKNLNGTCINWRELLKVTAVSNLLTDACIIALPLKTIWSLQMTKRRRLGLIALFLLGSLTVVFCIIRLVSQQIYDEVETMLILDCAVWLSVEPAIAIISACLPTLRPLFRCSRAISFFNRVIDLSPPKVARFLKNITGSSSSQSAASGGNANSSPGQRPHSSNPAPRPSPRPGGADVYHGRPEDAFPLRRFDNLGQQYSQRTQVVMFNASRGCAARSAQHLSRFNQSRLYTHRPADNIYAGNILDVLNDHSMLVATF